MAEEEKKQIDIDYYIKLVLKRRWFVLIPFCISMLIGIYFAITLPKVYSANNLILVVPKSVPDKYVPSVVETDIRQRIDSIKQQLLSRSNIELIIDKYELFHGPKYKHMFEIDKIESVKKNTSVKVTKSRGGINSFVIEFKGSNPKKVMNVVNTLSDSFIKESLETMGEEVIATNKFLQDELEALRERLQETESAIKKYREQHIGELPEELQSNLSTITRLQTQLSEKQENIRSAKNRLAELEAQMAIARSNAMSMSSMLELARPNKTSGSVIARKVSDLEQMQEQLKALNAKYTEKHPEVILLKDAIAELEKKEKLRTAENKKILPDKTSATSTQDTTKKAPAPKELDKESPILKAQYQEIIKEIIIYNDEIRQISASIDEYQRKVENTPKREYAIIDLKRNYENIRRSYNNLLDKKLASDIAVNMEKKQKGQKFRAIDKAKLPQKPISPDMKKLLFLFTALGLGAGGGLIFLLDYLDQSLKKPEELETLAGVPMLATIPEIYSKRAIIKHKINHAMSLCSALCALFLLGAFTVLALKGVDRTLEFIKKII